MFERCLYFNTNALARKLNARWDRAFEQVGLSPSHGYLLRLLLESPGLSQQEVADSLQLEKSTVTRFVQSLERSGWILRKSSASDLRQKGLFPTPKARNLDRELEALGDRLYHELCRELGKGKVRELVEFQRNIASKL